MENVAPQNQAEVLNSQTSSVHMDGAENSSGSNLNLILRTLQALPPDQIHAVLRQLDPRLLLDALQSSLPQQSPAVPKHDASPAARSEKHGAPMRVLKSGKLIYNNSNSVVDCQIREISESGCRIRVENSMGIPEHPMLQILDGKTKRQCQVAWKKLEEIGLEFID